MKITLTLLYYIWKGQENWLYEKRKFYKIVNYFSIKVNFRGRALVKLDLIWRF